MRDTGATICSTFDGSPADLGDPDPTDLDRLAASLDYLGLWCGEPDEAGECLPESAGEVQHFNPTALVAGALANDDIPVRPLSPP